LMGQWIIFKEQSSHNDV